jgi:hypothetical protein
MAAAVDPDTELDYATLDAVQTLQESEPGGARRAKDIAPLLLRLLPTVRTRWPDTEPHHHWIKGALPRMEEHRGVVLDDTSGHKCYSVTVRFMPVDRSCQRPAPGPSACGCGTR